jgi:hypothetical protein
MSVLDSVLKPRHFPTTWVASLPGTVDVNIRCAISLAFRQDSFPSLSCSVAHNFAMYGQSRFKR